VVVRRSGEEREVVVTAWSNGCVGGGGNRAHAWSGK
jgi:hypothetical protein